MGAAVTGLIAFALFLAGGLLLWANGHYKDADGYLSTGSQRFASHGYALTTPSLEIGAGAPGFLLKADRYGTVRLDRDAEGRQAAVRRRRPHPRRRRLPARRRPQRGLRHRLRAVQRPLHAAPRHAPPRPPAGAADLGGPAARTALTWNVQPGDWSVVVMNADGSRGVAAAVSAGAKVPYIAEFGYGTLGVGLLFIIATPRSRPTARAPSCAARARLTRPGTSSALLRESLHG